MAYSSIPGVQNYVGVRGVGQGGIVSTPFCCLYKLWTIKVRVDLYLSRVGISWWEAVKFIYWSIKHFAHATYL